MKSADKARKQARRKARAMREDNRRPDGAKRLSLIRREERAAKQKEREARG